MTPQSHRGRRPVRRGRHPADGAPKRQTAAIEPLHPTATPPDIDTFRHWPLGEEIQRAIEEMGITSPTPIQRLAIGPVLAGKDVIAKAETGTGKTLAFGAPMIAKIDPQRASVLGLVLCPTRELAEQVQKVLAALGAPRGISVALIVGGEPAEPQVRALKAGAQVVVGTPGRILDLYKQKFLSFPWTEFAILDEADVMFEIGFIDDVKEILSLTPDERQTLLFSATFPPELLKLARENTRDPAEVATASGLKTVDTIEQSWIRVGEDDRALTLMRLIENSEPDDVFLVFCARRTEVDKLMRRLERLPYGIKALHGGYDQAARFRVMSAFRTGEVKALVATDVASRGLDVAHVTHVVNYTAPQDITDYTHRIGRTGRAGRSGRAITLVGDLDFRRWKLVQRGATWDIPEAEAPRRGPRPLPPRGAPPRPAPSRSAGAPANAAGDRLDGRRPRPLRAWPRDEHAPRQETPRRAQARAPEPRPDDPLDRRDRPLRSRDEAPRWPVDDDAPAAARERQDRPQPERPRGDHARGSGAPERHTHGARAHPDRAAARRPHAERPQTDRRAPERPDAAPRAQPPRAGEARGAGPGPHAAPRHAPPRREHADRAHGTRGREDRTRDHGVHDHGSNARRAPEQGSREHRSSERDARTPERPAADAPARRAPHDERRRRRVD